MANYSISNHTLSFSDTYNQLYVTHSSNGVVATLDLNSTSYAVAVSISGTDFVVGTAELFTNPTHTWDVNGGDAFSFTSSTLDGIVIVDVRDINRLDLDEGQYEISYALNCTTYRLRNVSGSDGFLIEFSGTGCFSTQEIE